MPVAPAREITLTDEQQSAVERIVNSNNDAQTLGGFAGCLSGDTVLRYVRGNRVNHRPITLCDMFLKFNGGYGSGRGAAQRWDKDIPTYLYSIFPDGFVDRNHVVAVLRSGHKQVIRLSFSDGNCLVLTPDHPIATPSGEFVEAETLGIGDLVLAVGDMKTKSVGRRPWKDKPPRVVVNVKYYPFGGAKTVVCNGIAYAYKRVHRARLVVEAAMNDVSYERFVWCLKNSEEETSKFMFLPQNMDVHHQDEDPMNDVIDNLEVIPHNEHPKLHDSGKHFNRERIREVSIVKIEELDERMTYDVQMESPANNFAANEIFVHNTGKTTVIRELVRRLPDYAVCAYTGKAANVLRRKGMAASTIHALIYRPVVDEVGRIVDPVEFELIPRWEFKPHGIIVDEASMVGKVIHADLLSLQVPLIFVGDHGQLEPVGDTGFNLMATPDVTLETIHRNAGPIARFAEHLRRGGEARGWYDTEPDAPEVTITTFDHVGQFDIDANWQPATSRLNIPKAA